MGIDKSPAIVLQVTEFSETSCVATLFTREWGKVTGLAKGAYRRRSAFEGALDHLSIVRLAFIRKSAGTLDLLTEARLERRFRGAEKSLERMSAGFLLAELIRLFTEPHDPHPALYDRAQMAVLELDAGDSPPPLTVIAFELELLRQVGHAPMLDGCAGCATALPAADRYMFGVLAGGLLCPACRTGQRLVISISHGAVLAARAIIAGDPAPPRLSPREFGELRGVLNQFESSLLGFRPRIQDWIAGAGI